MIVTGEAPTLRLRRGAALNPLIRFTQVGQPYPLTGWTGWTLVLGSWKTLATGSGLVVNAAAGTIAVDAGDTTAAPDRIHWWLKAVDPAGAPQILTTGDIVFRDP